MRFLKAPAVTAVLTLVVLAAIGAAQQPVPTLAADSGPLYLLPNSSFGAQPGATPAPCLELTATTGPSVSATFAGPVGQFNGSYYPYPQGTSIEVSLRIDAPATGGITVGNGVDVTAQLTFGGGPTLLPDAGVSLANNQATTIRLNFPVDKDQFNATQGDVQLVVTLSKTPVAPGQPGQGQNIALHCDHSDSQIVDFQYGRGQPGDGDIDGDSEPDSEDSDRDGDSVPNAQEDNRTCEIDGQNVSFADHPDLMPGSHDADNDTFSDEEECAAGAHPLQAGSTPPKPAGFPWALVVTILVVILLIVALIWLALRFGKVALVTVVSDAQAIIRAGSTVVYDVAIESRRKSGDPIMLQLAVEGIPEGWDAITSVDHVQLGAKGSDDGHHRVELRVDSPGHADAESAVVIIRATPLNKEGRKDTFKVAGKAKTITSINVPPDAKVPVKRGKSVRLASTTSRSPKDYPVSAIPAITSPRERRLRDAGIDSTEQLRAADTTTLARKTRMSEDDVRAWQRQADLLHIRDLEPDHLGALNNAGITTPAALAAMKPDDVARRVNSELGIGGA